MLKSGRVNGCVQTQVLITFKQALLQKRDVMEEVKTNRTSEDGVFRDFCDGSFVQNHPLFLSGQDTLQLSIYFDELEVANPLGSKRGKHKLGKISIQ